MKSLNYSLEKKTIKHWAEEDRPREKLLNKGPQALTTAELLAIIIGSGTRKMTAVELAQHIMASTENDLNILARKSIRELTMFDGIGRAKAIILQAVMEIGRRRNAAALPKRIAFTSSRVVYNFMDGKMRDLTHEEFWVLLLNKRLQLISAKKVSSGGLDATIVDTRVIFRMALDEQALAMILVHNHPSGNPKPSSQDIAITRKLYDAGKLMGIDVADHLILWNGGYYSFRDEGQSPF